MSSAYAKIQRGDPLVFSEIFFGIFLFLLLKVSKNQKKSTNYENVVKNDEKVEKIYLKIKKGYFFDVFKKTA